MIRRLAVCSLLALCLCSCRSTRIPTPDPGNSVTTDWMTTNGLAAQITFFPARLSVKKRDNLYARVTVRNESGVPFAIPKGNAGEDFGRMDVDSSPKQSAILRREWSSNSAPLNPHPGNYCVVYPGQTVSSAGLIGILRPPVKGSDPRPVLMLRAGAFQAYRVRTGVFAAYFTRRGADRFFLSANEQPPDNIKNMEEAVGAPAWIGDIRTPSFMLQIKE